MADLTIDFWIVMAMVNVVFLIAGDPEMQGLSIIGLVFCAIGALGSD